MKLKATFAALALLAIIFVVAIPIVQNSPTFAKYKHNLAQSPEILQRVIHVYRSFRKLPDLVFAPIQIFTKSNLPNYEIFIPETELAKLNSYLGADPFGSELKEENKVWVRAEFRAEGYDDNVDIKYRGNQSNHWNSYKKSYTIKFPKDNLFKGMRELTLTIPVDREYFSTPLNNYRARKMGLLVPENFYVRLSVNGSTEGVMLARENWSQEWVEKQPVSALSTLYGFEPFSNFQGQRSMYDLSYLEQWKSWNRPDTALTEVKALIDLLQNATDEEFEQIAPLLVDLESFYAQATVLRLTGSYHTNDGGDNLVLFFDATEGRFKTIPYNGALYEVLPNVSLLEAPMLQKRIWNIPTFKTARDKYIANYVNENAEDDLAFVGSWIDKMKIEFLRDNAKIDNNFVFLSKLKKLRQLVAEHLKLNPLFFAEEYPKLPHASSTEPLDFPDEFAHLANEAIASVDDFLADHRQFSQNETGIILRRGTYVFSEDIIIPVNTHLTIEPGATLLLGTGVSLISYSPINLNGTAKSPITIRPLGQQAWGSIAVLNTEAATSTISYTTFEKGSEENLQGVWFSGALALHNANGVVTNSTFMDIAGEDAYNAKGSLSVFKNNTVDNTFSDGIDLDYVSPLSVTSGNSFANIGGDAIDISWSDITIENNEVAGCSDKGISVGESSKPTILKNQISSCDMGVAVKDSSRAIIEGNQIANSRIDLAAYQKKPYFGGGYATSTNNAFTNNQNLTFIDPVSTIVLE